MEEKLPRFLLIENLNRLAKWLRLLGYDAALYRSTSFHNLKRIAYNDRRIILTRDTKHIGKGSKDIVLIRSTDLLEQLKEIKKMLIYGQENLFNRCILCNKLLYGIDRHNIKEMVPEYIFDTHKEFKVCRKCGKIYWQGTHYKKILDVIKDIFNKE
jgi:uncharacterized protein